MEKQNYIGRKVKGFSFDDGVHVIGYNEEMNEYVGQIGSILHYDCSNNTFKIIFQDQQSWYYPASLIDKYLVPEEKDETELRDQFAMQAMNAFLQSEFQMAKLIGTVEENDESLAITCYRIADAMLKARKEVKSE